MAFDNDDKYYPDELNYMGFKPQEVNNMSQEKRDFFADAERGGFSRSEAESRWINERDD